MKELYKILQSQGFGTKKECIQLIQKGRVLVQGELKVKVKTKFELENLEIEVDGVFWTCSEKLYLVLNKPPQYECSRAPQHNSSIFSLLPFFIKNRAVQGAGRLDVDTAGLYFLSDDGQFLHHLCSPKRKLPKTYKVYLKHSITEEQKNLIENGVLLHGEEELLAAQNVKLLSEKTVEMDILQGKYHQVKRMWAAASNRVEKLERVAVGNFALPTDLKEGEWKILKKEDLCLLGL